MTNNKTQIVTFYILLGLAALVVFMMWLPFLKLFALGAILAVLFLPIYNRLVKETKGRETLSAIITLVFALLIAMIPVYFFGQALFNELVGLYNRFHGSALNLDQQHIINSLPEFARPAVSQVFSDASSKFSDVVSNIFSSATQIISNAGAFFVSLILVFFTMFYLMRDAKRFKTFFNSILPISESHESLLVGKLERAVDGVVKGLFLVALAQGVVALVGFFIFGVPQPFLWAAFTVLAALVPTVGTSLALIPAVIYLFVTGHSGAAIGMAIWGALAVGTIDNFISPRLIGSKIAIHPIVVLFSVIGGLQLFGVIGFLLGPIFAAVFMALLEIYRTEFKEWQGN